MRYTLLEVAIDIDLLDFLQAGKQPVTQAANAGVFQVHLFARKAEGFTHADDLVRRQRTRAEPAFLTAAMNLCFQADARFAANVERAYALGAVGLVR